MTRRMRASALILLASIALWWLRDPAWLEWYRHGIHPDGWTGGRASFYVPSDADETSFELGGHDQFTMQVSIYVDGRLAERFSQGPEWRTVTLPLGGPSTSRRHRRIDIHVARAWGDPRKGVRIRF